jgi:hypothetical protein
MYLFKYYITLILIYNFVDLERLKTHITINFTQCTNKCVQQGDMN